MMDFQRTRPTLEQVALLKRFLDSPTRPGGTLSYEALRGFLFAIATAPVLVKPSEWLPDVFGQEEPAFENEKDVQSVLAAIMACYNDTVAATRTDGSIDPREVGIDMDSESAMREWSRGFLLGFEGLRKAWEHALQPADEEDRDHFDRTIAVLTVWADPKEHQASCDVGDDEFVTFLANCRELLPKALGLLASTGIGIYEATLATREGSRGPHITPPGTVGRNDPCPCGSGLKYKRCCMIN
jgi:uncharacterized protein